MKLQRKIEGQGGYSGLVVGRDAIYAQPTCAETAVWRLDRSGRLLGTSFNAPPKKDDETQVVMPGRGPHSACYSVRLERDDQGHVLAWDRLKRTAYQVDDQGNWSPVQSPLFAHFKEYGSDMTLKGVDVGEQSVFVGNYTAKERARGHDTVLYLPGENASREVLMPCNGFAVRRVAADATGYSAVTDRFLILGDMASAPDLP
ncbi:MAG: hypothetical protein DMF53_14750 [Acidobacteria bacterium]|nr:MAG: hypothetical protein DMF53_14750 [Acidobacteriota bacterium]